MNSKSFFIGLGLGFIFVSFLFLATHFFIPNEESLVLSDDDIISQARTLGMIFPMEQQSSDNVILKARALGMVFPENSSSVKNDLLSNTVSDDLTDDDISDDLRDTISNELIDKFSDDLPYSPPEEEFVSVIIYAGYSASSVAELLFNKGVIDSAYGFENFLKRNNSTTNLRTGSYYLPKNSSYELILDALTKKHLD